MEGARAAMARVLACVTVAMALASPIAVGKEDSPQPAQPRAEQEADNDVGTFESRLVILKGDDLVARAYLQALRTRFAEEDEDEDEERGGALDGHEQEVRRSLDMSARTRALQYPEAALASGEYYGRWVFEPNNGSLPVKAWRDIDHSSVLGYSSERIAYCAEAPHVCQSWFEEGRHRSREPLTLSGNARLQWENRVFAEPCRKRDDYHPPQDELQAALLSSDLNEAWVELFVVLNPCGEVRDVSISRSSRNRDIDRAAIKWVRNGIFAARVQALGGGRGTTGRIPVNLVRER